MIVEFRDERSLGGIVLDAKELIKLMKFVVQYIPKDCIICVRDEFERIVVETTKGKIIQLCLDYDPDEKEETP